MASETFDAVVVGTGCGSIIGWKLALEGLRVAIVDRGAPGAIRTGSTFRNHRIKHSGAMQSEVGSAQRLWRAFSTMDPLERTHIRSTGGTFVVPRSDADRTVARWRAAGIPFDRLDEGASCMPSVRDVDAFATPDAVIDYPGIVRDALRGAAAAGARIVGRAAGTILVRDADRIVGIRFEGADGSESIRARDFVVAAGAWAPELLDPIDVTVPIQRWKTHIVALPGELVPGLTVHVGPPLLVFVPFADTTLVGDARRTRASRGDDRSPDPASVAAIRDDIATAFPDHPAAAIAAGRVIAGVKTEVAGHGSRAQDLALFGESAHGIAGLTVAFPGKASLMFALADEVITELDVRSRSRTDDRPPP